jgi:hypothetical protein
MVSFLYYVNSEETGAFLMRRLRVELTQASRNPLLLLLLYGSSSHTVTERFLKLVHTLDAIDAVFVLFWFAKYLSQGQYKNILFWRFTTLWIYAVYFVSQWARDRKEWWVALFDKMKELQSSHALNLRRLVRLKRAVHSLLARRH